MIWAHILSAHIIFYFESFQGKHILYAHWIALIAKIFVQIIAQVFQGNIFWLFSRLDSGSNLRFWAQIISVSWPPIASFDGPKKIVCACVF